MWIKPWSRRSPRVARIRDFTAVALVWCFLLHVPHDGLASDLSEVFLEARKPAEKQNVVSRASNTTQASKTTQTCETTDEDPGPLGWLGAILDGMGELRELLKDDTNPSNPSWYQETDPPPEIAVAPPASTSGARLYTALKSLHVRPSDTALENLNGGGIEIGGVLPSGLRMGAGFYSLRGQVREDSPAYGGLTNAYEFAIDAQARFFFDRFVAGFAGIRGGRLGWYYANPVFAIDELGHGEEIWRDNLLNLSGYWGLGLTPIHTDFVEIGVDLGAGYRDYFDESHEGFHNDVFAGGWFTQISVELALRF